MDGSYRDFFRIYYDVCKVGDTTYEAFYKNKFASLGLSSTNQVIKNGKNNSLVKIFVMLKEEYDLVSAFADRPLRPKVKEVLQSSESLKRSVGNVWKNQATSQLPFYLMTHINGSVQAFKSDLEKKMENLGDMILMSLFTSRISNSNIRPHLAYFSKLDAKVDSIFGGKRMLERFNKVAICKNVNKTPKGRWAPLETTNSSIPSTIHDEYSFSNTSISGLYQDVYALSNLNLCHQLIMKVYEDIMQELFFAYFAMCAYKKAPEQTPKVGEAKIDNAKKLAEFASKVGMSGYNIDKTKELIEATHKYFLNLMLEANKVGKDELLKSSDYDIPGSIEKVLWLSQDIKGYNSIKAGNYMPAQKITVFCYAPTNLQTLFRELTYQQTFYGHGVIETTLNEKTEQPTFQNTIVKFDPKDDDLNAVFKPVKYGLRGIEIYEKNNINIVRLPPNLGNTVFDSKILSISEKDITNDIFTKVKDFFDLVKNETLRCFHVYSGLFQRFSVAIDQDKNKSNNEKVNESFKKNMLVDGFFGHYDDKELNKSPNDETKKNMNMYITKYPDTVAQIFIYIMGNLLPYMLISDTGAGSDDDFFLKKFNTYVKNYKSFDQYNKSSLLTFTTLYNITPCESQPPQKQKLQCSRHMFDISINTDNIQSLKAFLEIDASTALKIDNKNVFSMTLTNTNIAKNSFYTSFTDANKRKELLTIENRPLKITTVKPTTIEKDGYIITSTPAYFQRINDEQKYINQAINDVKNFLANGSVKGKSKFATYLINELKSDQYLLHLEKEETEWPSAEVQNYVNYKVIGSSFEGLRPKSRLTIESPITGKKTNDLPTILPTKSQSLETGMNKKSVSGLKSTISYPKHSLPNYNGPSSDIVELVKRLKTLVKNRNKTPSMIQTIKGIVQEKGEQLLIQNENDTELKAIINAFKNKAKN